MMPKDKKAAKKSSAAPQAPVAVGSNVHHLFDDFARSMESWPFYRRALDWEPVRRMEKAVGMMVPDIDATETDNEMRITAELPGMEDKDINVDLSGDMLTIRGEKRDESESEEKNYHVSERRYGSFSRTVRVPESVDGTKISAEMKNGVLTVSMPKSAVAKDKQRKIPIKAS